MQSLNGKVAIVTGASRGMGRHFVDALVAAGAKVAAFARPSDALEKMKAEANPNLITIACDVGDSGQVDDAIKQTITAFGRLDIVVNNAGIFNPIPTETASDKSVISHFTTNVFGPIWMIRSAIPHLRKTQGQIVNISSESVHTPFPMLGVYAASKAALESFSDALRDEIRSDNIRVTILRSGSVAGSTGNINWSEADTQAFYKKIAQTGHAHIAGEAATPESMAAALVSAVTLPADVSVDLIVVRAAREGVPEGAEEYL